MKTFEEWYNELYELAKEKNCEWLISPINDYPEDSWIDGIESEEELQELISICGSER